MVETRLWDLAHARSGDKGDRSNIALVCRDPADYERLRARVTEAFVAQVFAERGPTQVRRYELPRLAAFNFVLDGLLEGGVNSSLGLDGHGKALSFQLLSAVLPPEAG